MRAVEDRVGIVRDVLKAERYCVESGMLRKRYRIHHHRIARLRSQYRSSKMTTMIMILDGRRLSWL